jgi:hypothetical protein
MTIGKFEIFRHAPNQRRAIIGMVMMTGHQFLGSFVLANYRVLIYASLALTDFVPLCSMHVGRASLSLVMF